MAKKQTKRKAAKWELVANPLKFTIFYFLFTLKIIALSKIQSEAISWSYQLCCGSNNLNRTLLLACNVNYKFISNFVSQSFIHPFVIYLGIFSCTLTDVTFPKVVPLYKMPFGLLTIFSWRKGSLNQAKSCGDLWMNLFWYQH